MINVSTGGISPALLNPLPEASAPVAGSGIQQLDSAQLMQKMGTVDEMTKTLAAMGLTPPANASAPAAAMQALLKALGDPSGFVGMDIQAVMELFVKLADGQRTAAMVARSEAMQGQVDLIQGAADKIKQAAQDRMASAIAQGALQIASGVIQMGSAVAGSAGAHSTGAGVPRSMETMKSAATGAGLKAGADLAGRMNGDAMSNAFKAADSLGQMQADANLQDQALLEAGAKVHEAAAQSANDMMQQMMDVIRDIRDKLASLSQIESSRGMVRNV